MQKNLLQLLLKEYIYSCLIPHNDLKKVKTFEQEYKAFSTGKSNIEENAERFKIALEFAKTAEDSDTLNYGVLDLKDLKDITFTYRSKIRPYLGDGENLKKKMERAIGIMNESDIGEKTGYINLKYDIGAYFMEGSMQ